MITKTTTNEYGISSFLVEKKISEKLCQDLLDAGWFCCIIPNKYTNIEDENFVILNSNCSEKIATKLYRKI